MEETPGPHRPRDIAQALISGGLETEARNFATSVSAILAGLEKKNVVRRDHDGGWRALAEQEDGGPVLTETATPNPPPPTGP